MIIRIIMIIFLTNTQEDSFLIMTEFYKEIHAFIYRLIGDKDLAKDLTQDTYEKALNFKIDKKIENKRAYLYKIAKNVVIDRSRKNKNYSEIIYEEENHSISKKEETEELLRIKNKNDFLVSVIKKLSPRIKESFYLHVMEGYSRKEIAKKMGISVSAVEKNIQRATKKIQEEIAKKGVKDDY